jgi:ubiquinone/menaquinone biosynthesis C-methylase UbiE
LKDNNFSNKEIKNEGINYGILRHIGRGNRILDIGCGSGRTGQEMKKNGNYVVGLDISDEQIEIARQSLDEAYQADLTQVNDLPFSNKKFDVIVFGDILEHLVDPGGILKFYRRFLEKNGKAIISIPNIANYFMRLKLLFGKFEYSDVGFLDKTHLRFFTLKTSREMIQSSGYYVHELDCTPYFLRALLPLIYSFLRSRRQRDTILKHHELNKIILASKLYREYLRFVYPIERWVASLWKSLFAFQFIIVAKPLA